MLRCQLGNRHQRVDIGTHTATTDPEAPSFGFAIIGETTKCEVASNSWRIDNLSPSTMRSDNFSEEDEVFARVQGALSL